MPKRRIIIPEITNIANNLRLRGQTRLATVLDSYTFPMKKASIPKSIPKKIEKTNMDDKIAKFNFLCGGNDAS